MTIPGGEVKYLVALVTTTVIAVSVLVANSGERE
jgi:hypothetical protein